MRRKVSSITAMERRVSQLARASRRIPAVITVIYPETFWEAFERTCKEYGCNPSEVGPYLVAPGPEPQTDEEWIALCESTEHEKWWGRVWEGLNPKKP